MNLITSSDVYSRGDMYVFKFSNIFPTITIVVYLVFLLFAAYNFYLDQSLNNQIVIRDKWLGVISNYDQELKTAREVEEKSNLYKSILDSRTNFKVKLNTIIKNLPEDVVIIILDADNEKFRIALRGENVLLFARLILLYLGSEEVSQISLTSAIFDSKENIYTVEFSGQFY